MGRAVEVVVLPVVDRPVEDADGDDYQDNGDRHQNVENGHVSCSCNGMATDRARRVLRGRRLSRRALSTTSSELADIPAAARAGDTRPIRSEEHTSELQS